MKKMAVLLSGCVLMCMCGGGCEDETDDHVPSQGMGALVIDNRLIDDLELYVDGEYKGRIGDDSDRAFDLAPGVYRVVLNGRHYDGSYRDDVDVLLNRLTIMRVYAVSDRTDEYRVEIEFD